MTCLSYYSYFCPLMTSTFSLTGPLLLLGVELDCILVNWLAWDIALAPDMPLLAIDCTFISLSIILSDVDLNKIFDPFFFMIDCEIINFNVFRD